MHKEMAPSENIVQFCKNLGEYNPIVAKVYGHPLVHVYMDAIISEATGYVGNFVTKIKSDRRVAEIKHGAAVIATGADVYRPAEYLFGQDKRILTHLVLEEKISNKEERIINAKNLVMIQCIGSRCEGRRASEPRRQGRRRSRSTASPWQRRIWSPPAFPHEHKTGVKM